MSRQNDKELEDLLLGKGASGKKPPSGNSQGSGSRRRSDGEVKGGSKKNRTGKKYRSASPSKRSKVTTVEGFNASKSKPNVLKSAFEMYDKDTSSKDNRYRLVDVSDQKNNKYCTIVVLLKEQYICTLEVRESGDINIKRGVDNGQVQYFRGTVHIDDSILSSLSGRKEVLKKLAKRFFKYRNYLLDSLEDLQRKAEEALGREAEADAAMRESSIAADAAREELEAAYQEITSLREALDYMQSESIAESNKRVETLLNLLGFIGLINSKLEEKDKIEGIDRLIEELEEIDMNDPLEVISRIEPEANEKANQVIEKLTVRLGKLEKDVENYNIELEEARERLNNLEFEKSQLSRKLESSEGNKKDLEEKLESAKKEIEETKSAIEELNGEKEKLEKELAEAKAGAIDGAELAQGELARLVAEKNRVEMEMEQTQQDLEEASKEFENKKNELEAYKSEAQEGLKSLESEKIAVEAAKAKAKENLENINRKKSDIENSLSSAEASLSELQQSFEIVEKQKAKLEEEKLIVEKELSGLELTLTGLNESLGASQERLRKAENEKAESESKLEKVKSELQSLNESIEEVQSQKENASLEEKRLQEEANGIIVTNKELVTKLNDARSSVREKTEALEGLTEKQRDLEESLEEAKEELDKIHLEQEAIESTLEAVKENKGNKEDELTRINEKSEEITAQLIKAESNLSNLLEKNEGLAKEIEEEGARLQFLEEEKGELLEANSRIELAKTQTEVELSAAQENLDSLHASLEEKRNLLANLKSEEELVSSNIKSIQEGNNTKKEELSGLVKEKDRILAEIKDVDVERESASRNRSSLLAQAQKEKDAAERRAIEAESALAKAQEDKESAIRELNERAVKNAQDLLDAKEEEFNILRASLAELDNKNSVLEEGFKEAQRNIEGNKRALSAKSNRIAGLENRYRIIEKERDQLKDDLKVLVEEYGVQEKEARELMELLAKKGLDFDQKSEEFDKLAKKLGMTEGELSRLKESNSFKNFMEISERKAELEGEIRGLEEERDKDQENYQAWIQEFNDRYQRWVGDADKIIEEERNKALGSDAALQQVLAENSRLQGYLDVRDSAYDFERDPEKPEIYDYETKELEDSKNNNSEEKTSYLIPAVALSIGAAAAIILSGLSLLFLPLAAVPLAAGGVAASLKSKSNQNEAGSITIQPAPAATPSKDLSSENTYWQEKTTNQPQTERVR